MLLSDVWQIRGVCFVDESKSFRGFYWSGMLLFVIPHLLTVLLMILVRLLVWCKVHKMVLRLRVWWDVPFIYLDLLNENNYCIPCAHFIWKTSQWANRPFVPLATSLSHCNIVYCCCTCYCRYLTNCSTKR
jgi:hypothetical protein